MKITVMHGFYGCDSGCCGHYVEFDGEREGFFFDHPDSAKEAKKFAQELVRKEFGEDHVADLDWENCIISVD